MSEALGRPTRHVAVLIESSRSYGRGLIEGVVSYNRERRTWSIAFEPHELGASPQWLRHWKGDGILSRLTDHCMIQDLAAKRIPVVHLSVAPEVRRPPMVASDNERIAQLAFQHLWERGLRRFGLCGEPLGAHPYMIERGESFRRQSEAAGCPCSVFAARTSALIISNWEENLDQIAAWLAGLTKPVGVMASIDERGFQVLSACARAGLRVPEEVAVIGVSADPVLCELSTPPMSSVDLDTPRIGYAAAALLDRLMSGARPPGRPIRIPPRGLVARHSTALVAFDDPDVAAALEFIRDHACDGIRVEDVVRHVAISCSTLERKFRRRLGRTPKAELLRVQMDRARMLVTGSALPFKEVARDCGFSSESYFGDVYFRTTGLRPGADRRQHRGLN
jgi:LacI family transcriptional regulator